VKSVPFGVQLDDCGVGESYTPAVGPPDFDCSSVFAFIQLRRWMLFDCLVYLLHPFFCPVYECVWSYEAGLTARYHLLIKQDHEIKGDESSSLHI